MQIESLYPMTSARLVVMDIEATLQSAARALSKPHIDLLIICGQDTTVTGVVSKSDIIRHLAVAGGVQAPVAALMTRNIVSCCPEDDLYATWQRMAARSLQNLPVLNAASQPLGVLDIRDALKALFKEEEYQEKLLFNYVAGIGYQ